MIIESLAFAGVLLLGVIAVILIILGMFYVFPVTAYILFSNDDDFKGKRKMWSIGSFAMGLLLLFSGAFLINLITLIKNMFN